MSDLEQQALMLQLLAHARWHGSAEGNPPTPEELASMLEKKLSDTERRAEILSWLARSPELFAQWVELVENQEVMEATRSADADAAAEEATSRFTQYTEYLSGLLSTIRPATWASCCSALLFVVLYTTAMLPEDMDSQASAMADIRNASGISNPTNQSQIQSGTEIVYQQTAGNSNTDWQLASFRSGYLSKHSVQTAFAAMTSDQQKLNRFGRLVRQASEQCTGDEGLSEAIKRDIRGLTLGEQTTRAWRSELAGLVQSIEAGGDQACRRLRQIELRFL